MADGAAHPQDRSTHGDREDAPATAAADAARPPPPRLVVWAAGSFHATLLVVLLVGGVHLAGAAGDLLAGLGTLPGAVAYLYLWAATTWTTGRGLRTAEFRPDDGVSGGLRAAGAALLWGGVTGVGVLLPVLVLLVGSLALAGDDGVLVAALVFGGVGLPLAATVGAVVGLAFAGLDLLLDAVSGLLVGDVAR